MAYFLKIYKVLDEAVPFFLGSPPEDGPTVGQRYSQSKQIENYCMTFRRM